MQTWVSVTLKFDNNVCVDLLWWPKFLLYILELFSHHFWHKLWRSDFYFNFNLFWLSVGSPISPDVRPGSGSGRAKILSQFWASLSKQNLFRMLTGCQKDRTTCQKTDWQTDRLTERQIEDKTTFQLSYQNKVVQNVNRMSESQSDRQKDIHYTVRQADRVTERQNDSIALWQNSRPAGQLKSPLLFKNSVLSLNLCCLLWFSIQDRNPWLELLIKLIFKLT